MVAVSLSTVSLCSDCGNEVIYFFMASGYWPDSLFTFLLQPQVFTYDICILDFIVICCPPAAEPTCTK